MEQKNEQLMLALVKQYSKLSFTSESVMTDRLKNINWRGKEKYRLKIQRKVALVGLWIVIIGFCFVVFITIFKNSNNLGSLNVPLLSYTFSFLSLLITLWVRSQTEERKRLFKLLQLLTEDKTGA
jgi:hypothetical protein